MVHLVDPAHVGDREVQDGAALGHGSVEVSRPVDHNLDLLGLLQVLFDRLTAELAGVQVVDQGVVVEDGVWVGVCELLKNL